MSRYIDADELKKQVCLDKVEQITKSPERRMMTFQEVIMLIDSIAPTIDIVRCGECGYNYGIMTGQPFNPEDIVCDYWASDGLDADDFCSYGERKESE